jgi:hypothetical protein
VEGIARVARSTVIVTTVARHTITTVAHHGVAFIGAFPRLPEIQREARWCPPR